MISSNSSARNSIDEGDGDKIYHNGDADLVRVNNNKVNSSNNKNNDPVSSDRANRFQPHHHHHQNKQNGKMEEQTKSTDQNPTSAQKKAEVISGDDISKESALQNGFILGDPNQPSKLTRLFSNSINPLLYNLFSNALVWNGHWRHSGEARIL